MSSPTTSPTIPTHTLGNLIELENTPEVLAPETQLWQAITSYGIKPPENIIFDNEFHRFGTKKSGWYKGFTGDIQCAVFGDFREDVAGKLICDNGMVLSPIEQFQATQKMNEAAKQSATLRKEKAEVASNKAKDIWDASPLAPPNVPYLLKKAVQPHGTRVAKDGRLIAPIYRDNEIISLQYIAASSEKWFLLDSSVKGGHWWVGDLYNENQSIIYIAEGFATASTIYEVTGSTTVIAFSASNIPLTTEAIRALHPMVPITIIADLDEKGVGEFYANQAAAKSGATVIVSPVTSDVNDFVSEGGNLIELLTPKENQGWLISVDEFSKKPAPIAWLVKNWLQDNAMIMVHGASGAGKTFIVLDWCLKIASTFSKDIDWLGHQVHGGTVVYLAGEGHHGLKGRIAAWKQVYNPTTIDMFISSTGTDLNTPYGLIKVTEAVQSLPTKPKLIVVDTLHRFLSGDENSAQDTKSMLDACSLLMGEFNCSVLLVHHTGVSAEAQHRARGSSAWKGALDNEISISSKKGTIEIQAVKMKDSEQPEKKFVELESVPIDGWLDEDGEAVTSAIPVPSTKPEERRNNKILEDITGLEKAWDFSGKRANSGMPYITKSAWMDYLVTEEDVTEASAKQAMKIGVNRIANRLVESAIIKEYEMGFVVVDDAISTAMVL